MVYTFYHMTRKVEFGPYDCEDYAKVAFQRRFGYWPENAIDAYPYGG